MPNMKIAKKFVRKTSKKTVANNNFDASMKTAIKNVEKAVGNKDKNKASAGLKVALKKIDKEVCKGNLIVFPLYYGL